MKICIHGHFYQPPRENPWLEEIEIQDSAYPYHDWNVRITAECYARNATARIMDDEGLINKITNNYARMSFNFGPTLLSWLERGSPAVYAAVIDADAQSRERFSGHGSALALPYNHMILPLATAADRNTQILWGIRDFQHRFNRSPEGMWLPETAVDLETLSNMARHGIRFTILSPHQARRVRPSDTDAWLEVGDGAIDTRRPYVQRLPEGTRMVLFFYDGVISREVAFDALLNDGDAFVSRLVEAADEKNDEARLIHLAVDGETFGHHHRRGDMALAYALEKIDSGDSAQLTNYGEYLQEHPPDWEVEIKADTSWSCPHGLERWRGDCGCHSGRRPEWHQGWRAPLREALDWLRDTLAATFIRDGGGLFADPHQARDDYIEVILDRRPEAIDRFLDRHLVADLKKSTRTKALQLLESQRQAMLMYTSCGWFFDDLSGIEAVQVLQYAGRALQLAQELSGTDLQTPFLDKLALAKSNIPRHGDGRRIFEKWVLSSRVDLKKVAAHYAISSLFEDYPAKVSLFCHSLENQERHAAEAGKAKIAVGRAHITAQVTRESEAFCYAVLHLGDHTISCGVNRLNGALYEKMAAGVLEKFEKSDIPGVFQDFGDYFGGNLFSPISLFRDEKRKVLETILTASTSEALGAYRQLYAKHVALMRFVHASGGRIPKALYAAGEIVINSDLKKELGRRALDSAAIRSLIEDAERAGIVLEADTLAFTARDHLNRLARDLERRPESADRLARLAEAVALCRELPFPVEFQEVQNIHFRIIQNTYPQLRAKAESGDTAAGGWVTAFRELAKMLHMRMT